MDRADLIAEIEMLEDHRIVRLSGELDLLGSPRLTVLLADLARTATGGIVLDLSELEFIDSTGIATLLNTVRRLARSDRRMAIVVGSGPVRRALEIARLLDDLQASDNVAEALAKVE